VRLGYRRSTNDALTPETPGGTVAPPHRQSPGISALIQEAFMALVTIWINSFLSRDEEEGQGLAEYALILALIAIVAIVALIFLGGQVSKILSTVGDSV
jgi:pilus assembly protein Flp/PilA